jgi:hypothetical protein
MELTMHRSYHALHILHAFDPIASAFSTLRGRESDPIAAKPHTAFQRSRIAGAMVAPPNLIQRHRHGFTAKTITLSAYEHGQNAAKRSKHLQACPFDTGTMGWRQWRGGFLSATAD